MVCATKIASRRIWSSVIPTSLISLDSRTATSKRIWKAPSFGNWEKFLLELGVGFSFVARQKRIQVDNDDYYLDLLFFHRRLKRLVAIELKLGEFKPADKGQMELYLRWLDKYERQPDEKTPIGLILCSGKKQETVKLLALEQSGIRVAKYLTELPPREILEQELHKAIAQAKERIDLQLEHRKEVGP